MRGSAAEQAGFAAGDEWLGLRVKTQAWRISKLDDVTFYAGTHTTLQALVAREVDENLVTIRDLSTQTAAGATQTSAASQELSRLAVDLNGLVTRFVI